jgi:2-phosphoglycerate kinase
MTENRVIVISDPDPGLPYSKGLRASQLMVTGLSPYRAYQVAEQIEERLKARKVSSVTGEELDELTIDVLSDLAGERYATNFLKWQEIKSLKVPLVILIGGATGVGKSTIATQIAVRLGIVRVVATDAVREVMRALFTSELMPTLYTSSFEADSALREPPARPADRIIVGFREQTAAISVGVHALIQRAAIEGTSVVIEGAHVVPGFLDLGPYEERVLAVPVVITVEDEELHRSHFAVRATDWATRPYERYMKGFANIRRVQKYIKTQALSHDVPVIPNYSLDQALSALIDLVVEKATERVRASGPGGAKPRRPGDAAIEMEAVER